MSGVLVTLKADAEELYRLAELTERRKIKDILTIEAKKIETEISKLRESDGNIVCSKRENVLKRTYDVRLNTYAWDQSSNSIKIFVTISNVETLPAENIECSSTDRSFELKVKELEGKNYILSIKNLCYPIEPDQCAVKVKPGMVILTFRKQTDNHWDDLIYKEKKATPKPKLDDKADPSAGIMNLMKQMYEDGDDEMKRTIAKAWTESREKNSEMNF